MTNGKMERHYFEEKKGLGIEGLHDAQTRISDVAGLLGAWSYEVPNIINAAEVHGAVCNAKAILDNARRDFEKVRWATSATDLDFDAWLIKHGHQDLVA